MKISLKDDINSISYVKSNFSDVLKDLKRKQRPLVITQNGKSSGVLLDIETWENLQKKITLLKLIAEGEQSLQRDEHIILSELEEKMKSKYDI
jgi:prevent-host-death family protein